MICVNKYSKEPFKTLALLSLFFTDNYYYFLLHKEIWCEWLTPTSLVPTVALAYFAGSTVLLIKGYFFHTVIYIEHKAIKLTLVFLPIWF